ncbi:unnamed protein product [Eretmochelys imbricata]
MTLLWTLLTGKEVGQRMLMYWLLCVPASASGAARLSLEEEEEGYNEWNYQGVTRMTGLVLREPELRLVQSAYAADVLLVIQDLGNLARVEACQAIYLAASSARVNWVKSSGLAVGDWRQGIEIPMWAEHGADALPCLCVSALPVAEGYSWCGGRKSCPSRPSLDALNAMNMLISLSPTFLDQLHKKSCSYTRVTLQLPAQQHLYRVAALRELDLTGDSSPVREAPRAFRDNTGPAEIGSNTDTTWRNSPPSTIAEGHL